MDEFYTIQTLLSEGRAAVVATILATSGSAPRRAGTRMVVDQGGQVSGTIGGGAVEHQVIAMAQEFLEKKTSARVSFNFNDPAGKSGLELICGGRVEILLEHVKEGAASLGLYQGIVEAIENGLEVALCGKLVDQGKEALRVERSYRSSCKNWQGMVSVDQDMEQQFAKQRHADNLLIDHDGQRYIVETLIPKAKLILLGGGHVAMELARLATGGGFQTVVVDDRKEFANSSRFPWVNETVVCRSWETPLSDRKITITARDCIVIATRGHGFDREALAWSLQTAAGYIGMIGSRRKRDSIYSQLMATGYSRQRLEQVHCPVGLAINAQTPFEIAVSIVAQLIGHRAKNKG